MMSCDEIFLCFCYIFLFDSVPQYVYPSAYMATPGVTIPTVSPHSPLSPSAAAAATGQLAFEYASAGGFSTAGAGQFANGYESAYPFTTAAAYMPTAAAAYATYATPQPVGHFAHFQQQQIQERMQ